MVEALGAGDPEAMTDQTATAPLPTSPATRRPGRLRALGRRLEQSGRDTGYLLLGLPMGIVTFTVIVTGISTTIGLAITIIGLVTVLATVAASRGLAIVERRRVAIVTGEPIPSAYRPRQADGFLARIWEVLKDPATWRDMAWHLLLLPIGIAGFTIAVTAWGASLGLLFMPVWYWALDGTNAVDMGLFKVDTLGEAFACSGIGLVALPLAVLLIRGTAALTVAIARGLLSPLSRRQLEGRVEALDEARAGAVDDAAEKLAQIERDLHDGAQARLVALAMDLGMAEHRLNSADPEAARELVVEAREEARQALAELRGLVRGIHPPLLADRGLPGAIPALADRSPIAAEATVAVPGRLPRPIEAAAYFVVAEALANAGKHSGATRVHVDVRLDGGLLRVAVADDGRGGADAAGSGLDGLQRRVAALDGRLTVTSPPGGGTVVRAELPCAS
jgi:signal transduction histidine kinase